jgi:hypothetical protein
VRAATLSRGEIYEQIREGRIKAVAQGRAVRFTKCDHEHGAAPGP